MATRDYSDEQEKHIAKVTGGKVQSNSGGTKFGGGDVQTKNFFIEAKTSMYPKKSFSVQKEWLIKAKSQAFEQGKQKYTLAFQFEPKGQNYYILNEKDFLQYLKYIEREVYTDD